MALSNTQRCARTLVYIWVISLQFSLMSADNGADQFNEELLINSLDNGFVNSYFKFTTSWNTSLSLERLHYNLFPKSLGQIVSKHGVQELHLSLTQGLWRHDKWGYPIAGAPPGTQLWVWFTEDTIDVDAAWADLVNALSGLFCASLNFIDETNTVKPQLSFRPLGLASETYARNTNMVRYATLPREVVCTENLTPWKKLLPCHSKAGLASLFKADKLYNAHYHSLAVHLRPVCQSGASCDDTTLELSQSVSVVFRPSAHKEFNTRQDWSLRTLFGKTLDGPCPMASVSKVYVDVTRNDSSNPLSVNPEPSEVVVQSIGSQSHLYAVYDVKQWAGRKDSLNVAMTWNQPFKYSPVTPPPLLAYRYLSGYGQEKGSISCLLRNDVNQPLKVIYTETIPWFMRLYLHTLKIKSGQKEIVPDKVVFVPGKDRSNPYLLEVVLMLPPSSDTTLRIDYDKAFLRWTEYPPDANIGFFINSAIVSVVLPSAVNISGAGVMEPVKSDNIAHGDGSSIFMRIYTEPLLIQLPTPDFSMPYNVICLACTVVAIAFGSLHNLTTRQFGFVELSSNEGFLKKLFAKFRRKANGVENRDGSGDHKEEIGDSKEESGDSKEESGDSKEESDEEDVIKTSDSGDAAGER